MNFEEWFKWEYKMPYREYLSKAAKALGDIDELEEEISCEYAEWLNKIKGELK